MDATLTKTQRVMHLVQPGQFDDYAMQPGGALTFTSRADGRAIGAVDPDDVEPIVMRLTWGLWSELGRPNDITITVRPGDTLND